MKRLAPVLALTLLTLLASIAIAQSGALPGLTQPVLVTVSQSIPADITLAIPQEDGAVLTVTAPITVGVNLQITIDGAHVVAVEAAEAAPPTVTTEAQPPAGADPWDNVPTIIAMSTQTQSAGGIDMTVQGVGIFEADAAAHIPEIGTLLAADPFRNATAIGMMRVSVTNTADSKVRYAPTDGAIVIGSEQIDLRDYRTYGDDLDGEIYPGVNKQGIIFFAVKATPWDELAGGASAFIDAGQPTDADYNRLGDAPMEFAFDLTPR